MRWHSPLDTPMPCFLVAYGIVSNCCFRFIWKCFMIFSLVIWLMVISLVFLWGDLWLYVYYVDSWMLSFMSFVILDVVLELLYYVVLYWSCLMAFMVVINSLSPLSTGGGLFITHVVRWNVLCTHWVPHQRSFFLAFFSGILHLIFIV